MDFKWEIFTASLPFLLHGALVTIEVSVLALIGSIVLGLCLAFARLSRFRILSGCAFLYVLLIRGTPLLMQLTLIYYGLPRIGITLPAMVAGVIGLSFNDGAYISEIFRAGIQSIPKGQLEAARALSVPPIKIMRYIVLPQALRVIIPPTTNEAVIILKNSSLLSVIAIAELMQAGLNIVVWKANVFSPLIGVSLIYLTMTLPLIYVVRRLEKRFSRHI